MEYTKEMFDKMNYQINKYRELIAKMEDLKNAEVKERDAERGRKDRVIAELVEEVSTLKKQLESYNSLRNPSVTQEEPKYSFDSIFKSFKIGAQPKEV